MKPALKAISSPTARPPQKGKSASSEVHYTVFVRLPFPRGDFIDPQPVNWDASKDRALWETLSRASRTSDLDWNKLANDFVVTLPFLLQQAAWLYERQLSQVRAQLRKVGNPQGSNQSPSQTPAILTGNKSAGGHAMKRGGSSGAGPRAPSSLSIRSRESPVPRDEGSIPSTPKKQIAPPMSRNSSTSTAVMSRQVVPPSPRQPYDRSQRLSYPPPSNANTSIEADSAGNIPNRNADHEDLPRSPSERGESPSSSSSSSSEPAPRTSRSQTFKRPTRFASHKAVLDHFAEDEEDDDDPAFLPFSNPPKTTTTTTTTATTHDPSATLRGEPPQPSPERRRSTNQGPKLQRPQTTHSSASSAGSGPAVSTESDGAQSQQQRPPGPLSPRRAAELAGLSPRRRIKAREGSDGTPSMGSSFSDLDDASVTQSALEEALLSNMQHGNVASRMSTISQALRSRYL
ncbi:MAG: hypothetical protein M1827_007443 [Pycnora praestabilis]|nr:MAG: hypothetical protein M1827_007443 [Pycnora praestabilis]